MNGFFVRARRACWRTCLAVFVLQCITNQNAAHADLWGISTDIVYSRVIRFDPVTGDELSGGIPTGTSGLARPSGITTGPGGRLYVASRGDDAAITPKIQTFSCDTVGVCSAPTLFTDFTAGPDPTQPSIMRFGPDGQLYVAELFIVGGDDVRIYDPATGTRQPVNAATGVIGPGGIEFLPDGDLLVGTIAFPDFMIPATISRYEAGAPQFPYYVDTMGQLGLIASMLRLQNGDVLGVDLLADRIVRVEPDGDLHHFASIPTIIEGKPSFPSDIVFDPDGNLIVAVLGPNNPGEPGGNQGQLLRFGLAGNLIEVIEDELEQIGGLTWTNSPLTVVGNYDGIGGVDEDDYARWRRDFGKWIAPGNGADGNGNGVVDVADFIIWSKFASGGLGSDASGEVPEPTSASIVLTASLIAAAATRSKRLPSSPRC